MSLAGPLSLTDIEINIEKCVSLNVVTDYERYNSITFV